MTKVKINAGVEVDLITKDEVRDVFESWMHSVREGVRFRRASGLAAVAAGAFRSPEFGPRPGFIWSVTSITVAGNGFKAGTDTFGVYFDDVSAYNAYGSGYLANVGPIPLGALVVNSADRLVVAGVATLGGAEVITSMLVAEVPAQLAYQLL